jgi:rhodanese-related sulfurtransferase
MKTLITLAATALLAFSLHAGEYKDITIKDLKAAMAEKKVVLLDANGIDSWKEGHIPGAINFEAKKKTLAKALPKDKDTLVVAYCGGPKCTAYKEAAKAAEKLGYKNIKYFSAGISGWKEAGEPTKVGS